MIPEEVEDYEEGSFFKKDKIEKIVLYNSSPCQMPENLFFIIYWKKRANNKTPKMSYNSYNCIKKYEPYMLIKFWEELYK